MPRTFIRHTLSAFAAVALVSAFAAGPASAWRQFQAMSNISKADSDAKMAKPKTPEGLAAKKHSQRSRSIFGSDVRKELSLTDDQ